MGKMKREESLISLDSAWIPQVITFHLVIPACFKRESKKAGMPGCPLPRHDPSLP